MNFSQGKWDALDPNIMREDYNETCALAYHYDRPDPQPLNAYMVVNWIIVVFYSVYLVVTLTMFKVMSRSHNFLLKRSFTLLCVSSIGSYATVLSSMLIEVAGPYNFSCDYQLWMRTITLTFVPGALILRLIQFRAHIALSRAMAKTSFDKIQLFMDHDEGIENPARRRKSVYQTVRIASQASPDFDPTMAGSTSVAVADGSEVPDSPRSQSEAPPKSFTRAQSGRTAGGKSRSPQDDDDTESGRVGDNKSTVSSAQQAAAQKLAAEHLQGLWYRTKLTFALFVFMGGVFIPAVVAMAVVEGTMPYYGHGCVNCITGPIEIGTLYGMGMLYVALIAFQAYQLRDAKDPLEILKEIRFSIMAAIPIGSIGMIMYILDPFVGRFQARGIFNWDWLIWLGVSGFHTVQCTYQLYRAHQLGKDGATLLDDVVLKDILEDTAAKALFKEHLITEWSVENLVFWDQVNIYENEHGRNPRTSVRQARAILLTFILPRSVMEINIPGTMRDQIMELFDINPTTGEVKMKLEEGVAPSKALFSEAKEEIYELMRRDSLPRWHRTKSFKEWFARVAVRTADGIKFSPESTALLGVSGVGGFTALSAHSSRTIGDTS